jgi:hypothetical protein
MLLYLNAAYLYYFQIGLKKPLRFFSIALWLSFIIEFWIILLFFIGDIPWFTIHTFCIIVNIQIFNLMWIYFSVKLFRIIIGIQAIIHMDKGLKSLEKMYSILPFNLYKYNTLD